MVIEENMPALLAGGDRRGIGRANEVAALASADPKLFSELMEGLWSDNGLVRMRAADALEKVTREHPQLLQPYKAALLGLIAEAEQKELRWHLALMLPRLAMNNKERRIAISVLKSYLEDRSSIVKTCALQGLADLARDYPSFREDVIELLRTSARSGTPAMKARSRKLLLKLESSGPRTK